MQNDLSGKHIVFFAPETIPSFAGAGINAYAFAKYLSEYAGETTLCCLNYNKLLPKTVIKDSLCIKRLTYYNGTYLQKFLSFPILLLAYLRYVYIADILLVYSGYLIGFQFILFISWILGRNVIFRSTLIGGDDAESLLSGNFLIRRLNLFVFNRLNVYFAINPVFSNRFKKIFIDRVKVFESFQGINRNRFYPCTKEHKEKLRKKLQIASDELIILSVGILLKKKGYQQVFPELAKLNIPFRYIIAGDYLPTSYHKLSATEKKEMQDLVQFGNNTLGKKLKLLGTVDNIEDYYHTADIFLLPSLQEGTPNVLLEAMACSLPCITKKLAGISGVLTKHDSNSIEYSNAESLPAIIRKLLNNPEHMTRLGVKAAETLIENYTFEQVANKLFSALDD